MSLPILLAKKVSKFLEALDQKDCPKDAVCQHFGVNFRHNSDIISVSIRYPNTFISVYSKNSIGRGYTRRTHLDRQNTITKELRVRVIENWNGEDGHDGISFVVSWPSPKSLVIGINNYNKDDFNVFSDKPEDRALRTKFHTWFEQQLKKVGFYELSKRGT